MCWKLDIANAYKTFFFNMKLATIAPPRPILLKYFREEA